MAHLFLQQQQSEIIPSYPQSPTRGAVRKGSLKVDVTTPPRKNSSKVSLSSGSFHGRGDIGRISTEEGTVTRQFDLSWGSYSFQRSFHSRSSENSSQQQEHEQQQQHGQHGQEEVSARSSASAEKKLESDLKSWKQRLVQLERRYDEIGRDEKPSWEDMKKLLRELKRIMRNEQLKDVVEFQNGIARIKSKVLTIQQKWTNPTKQKVSDSNNDK